MSGESGYRAGFVAIVGRPNVGKSTLLNLLLKEKVAIVSDKPQTTRNRMRGILSKERFQIVFVDTPGIHQPRDEINRYMVQEATATLREVDLVLFLVEASRSLGKQDLRVGSLMEDTHLPVFLLINKVDISSRETVAAAKDLWRKRFPAMKIFSVSARTGKGVPGVLDQVVGALPEGAPFFPPDQIADQPVRFLCAELIREKVFRLTGEEVPYAVAVEVTSFREPVQDPSGPIFIDANIHVERPSQKGIIIGKGGAMIKRVGSEARRDMEALLGARVHLNLWVKVTRGWRNDPKSLRWLGYR
jgi:GTP-binding protein Era